MLFVVCRRASDLGIVGRGSREDMQLTPMTQRLNNKWLGQLYKMEDSVSSLYAARIEAGVVLRTAFTWYTSP